MSKWEEKIEKIGNWRKGEWRTFEGLGKKIEKKYVVRRISMGIVESAENDTNEINIESLYKHGCADLCRYLCPF